METKGLLRFRARPGSGVDGDAFPILYARLVDKQGRVIDKHGAMSAGLLPDARINGQPWIRIGSMSWFVTIAVAAELEMTGTPVCE